MFFEALNQTFLALNLDPITAGLVVLTFREVKRLGWRVDSLELRIGKLERHAHGSK